MRISLYLAIAACLAGMGVVLHGAILSSRDCRLRPIKPRDGKCHGRRLRQRLFSIFHIARLDGWTEGLAGTGRRPQSGYYVLGNWASER